MIWGSREFPGASYDSWKTRSDMDDAPYREDVPDPTYFDDDAAEFYYRELEELDELFAFYDTHERIEG